MSRSAQEQKTIIGFAIIAARRCHFTAEQEEKLDYALRAILPAYLDEDALEMYEEANKEGGAA